MRGSCVVDAGGKTCALSNFLPRHTTRSSHSRHRTAFLSAMSNIATVKILIKGNFPENSTGNCMGNWIVRRARLLDLSGRIEVQNATQINLTVTGDRVLVEAFEVACSLGHFNAQVNAITSQEVPSTEPHYRQQSKFITYSAQRPDNQANCP